MSSITSSQCMYSLTLQPAGMVTHSIIGTFDRNKPRQQQILLARCERLSMHLVGNDQTKWQTILTTNTFGIIRKMAAIRIPGTPSDILIVTSDSGRIALLEYDPDKNRFDHVHLETYGKSGIRRTIPGMYLAVDPRGRCCMLASAEKNKIVYILNRNQEQKVTISSPQEITQQHTLTFALCAVDANFQNPLFAALEVVTTDIDHDPTDDAYDSRQKTLVYYRVDLGLNHVVREWSAAVDYSSNALYQVPGGNDGPSGVIVCAMGTITYLNYDHQPLTIKIPRRRGILENPDRDRRIVSGLSHRIKNNFFHLLQTDDGDVFKLTWVLETDANGHNTGTVAALELQYFDTLPVASTMSILKFDQAMFVASDSGNLSTYKFLDLGDDEPIIANSDPDVENPSTFLPHDLTHMHIFSDIPSLNPQKAALVDDIHSRDEHKIYSINGTGPRSTLRTITHGLPVVQHMAAQMPEPVQNMWSVSLGRAPNKIKYVILSTLSRAKRHDTVFLAVKGSSLDMAYDTGMRDDITTLHIAEMGESGIIQVWPKGFRYFVAKHQKPADWNCPMHKTILKACSNKQQLVLALDTGEILYYEVAPDMLSMQEYSQGPRNLAMDSTVRALAIGSVPEGRVRAPHLAVALDDQIFIFSLDPNGSMLEQTTITAISSPARSMRIQVMQDSTGYSTFLHVGLESGVYLRVVLDDLSGELSDARKWFLGPEPVTLAPLRIRDQAVMMACGHKTFLCYFHTEASTCRVTPVDFERIKDAAMVSMSKLENGILGATLTGVCAIDLPDLSNHVLTKSTKLQYTPRGFCRHPDFPYFNIVQSDANTLPKAVRDAIKADPSKQGQENHEFKSDEHYQWPKGNNYWASCIQIVDPSAKNPKDAILYQHELEDNEAALSCIMAPFKNQDDEDFLVVSTGKNMPTAAGTKTADAKPIGYVHIYRLLEGGKELELMHKTEFPTPVTALHAFQGQIALAVGPEVLVYDLGIKSLLRKARCRLSGQQIVTLNSNGSRLVAGDIQQSVFFISYNPNEEKQKLVPFADDTISRWTTAATMLDYDTVAGGDRYGNLWVVRCPRDASDEADEPGASNLIGARKTYLNGTPYRLDAQIHNYVQDIPMSISRASFVSGGEDVIFWAGLQGTLGILIPFKQRESVDFFTALETQLRSEDVPLLGREHLVYRGYYQPPKGCIDGDLCERFFSLTRDKKEAIAADMERTVGEIEKKIAEMRTAFAF